MQIIPTAWDAGKVGQIQEMLDRYPTELCGFEWYYWNRHLHSVGRTYPHISISTVY
jgi:hypothetical protein